MNPGAASVRPARQQDIPELVALWRDISLREFAEQIGQDAVDSFLESGALQEETADLIGQTFVAERAGRIVGFTVILDDLIELLLVAPAKQNGLVGKRLFAFARQQIARDHAQIRAECFAANQRANSMLKRLGFTCTGQYRDDMGFDTNRYTLALSQD